MSAIGRVFILLNLILAGAFVGFAGTYLQRANDWKKAHEELQAEYDEYRDASEKQKQSLSRDVNKATTELQAHKLQLENSTAEVAKLRDENKRLAEDNADLEADVKKLNANYTAIAGSIDQATKDAKAAYQTSLNASAERNDAVAARQEAEKALQDARFQMEKLRGQIADQAGRIAELEAENNEKDVLLAMVKAKAPGLLAMAQPDLQGNVHFVDPSGKLVTIEVTANPANAEIKPGYTFAIYSGSTYKGEAVVQNVEGQFAFANLTKQVEGRTVAAGDRAATNVGY